MVRPKLTGLPMHSRAIWTNLKASVGFQSGILQASFGLQTQALLSVQSNPDEMTTLLPALHLLQLQLIDFMTIDSNKLVFKVLIIIKKIQSLQNRRILQNTKYVEYNVCF